MKKIIYYVAVSLDGFISVPNDSIVSFVGEGNGVEQYLADLQKFKTVIMGRKTYEFGYKFGLVPGQPAYPHMEHFIFSNAMTLDNAHDTVHIEKISMDRIKDIRQNAKTDIYLCGGGQFAGWLLDHGQIDRLTLKINPIILGGGIRLFGDSQTACNWNLTETREFEHGLQIASYELKKNTNDDKTRNGAYIPGPS